MNRIIDRCGLYTEKMCKYKKKKENCSIYLQNKRREKEERKYK